MASLAATSAWPPAAGLSTVLLPRGPATVFSVFGSATINAPACLIFDTLRNTTSYPEWNTFTPSATIDNPHNPIDPALISANETFTYVVILDPAAPQNKTTSFEKVFDISTLDAQSNYVPRALLNDGSFEPKLRKVFRASWGDNNPATAGGLLVTQRFVEVTEVGTKKAVLHTWENFGGPVAGSVQPIQATLQARFADYARDLKGYSERLYEETKRGCRRKKKDDDARCCYVDKADLR
ncbi:MAG: hypothetical protein Q9168_006400 [Polycauliona sp. 1 TL-2023]